MRASFASVFAAAGAPMLHLPLAAAFASARTPLDFSAVDAYLASQVESHAFPGAVALIADASGVLHTVSVGRQTYAANSPPMSVTETLFDAASLTKVVVTTTAAMLLYQWGELHLDSPVVGRWPTYAAGDVRKARITPRHLLLHEAGLPPDPTPVSFCAPSFGCPETVAHPPAERTLSFSCQASVLAALEEQTLDRPPGERFVYSDISMMTMMFLIGSLARPHVPSSSLDHECVAAAAARRRAALVDSEDLPLNGQVFTNGVTSGAPSVAAVDQCYYEAFTRTFVLGRLCPAGTPFCGFRPPRPLWPLAAPAWNDTEAYFPPTCVEPYRQRLLHGEVSDGNAYVLGGISGHAGLFTTAAPLHRLAAELLSGSGPVGINETTARLFTSVHNVSRSSRGLGWDTEAWADPSQGPQQGLCGDMSARTFTHTGYTGTQICADPDHGGLVTVLLTNRVYPRADDESEQRIHDARVGFNNAVLAALAPEEAPAPRLGEFQIG